MGMIETASRIIARFGQEATFTRTVGGSETPWGEEESTTVEYPATVAVVSYDQEVQDGTLIQANDLRVLVAVDGLGIVPTVADLLTVGGKAYTIVRVTPLAPDGVARFFDLQVRR